MVGHLSILSVLIALLVAVAIGPLLGRLSVQWFRGRGLTNFLILVRGGFLPFIAAPLLAQSRTIPVWLSIALIVGLAQGVAVARWAARQTADSSPALRGGIALGHSGAALLSAHALSRGAIVATLALTTIEVITLEALLSAMELPPMQSHASIGGILLRGSSAASPFMITATIAMIFLTEMMASLIFQRRARGESLPLAERTHRA